MKKLVIALLAVTAACSAQQTVDPGAPHEHSLVAAKAATPTPELNAQLAAARAATARYHRFEAALSDNFEDINVFVPGMGYHYMNKSRVDAVFNPAEPELLVYSKEKNGRMRLVAVEYAVPLPLSAQAPAGFDGDADEWDRNTTFDLWLLHAWVWLDNPDGVFQPFNSRLQ